MLPEARDAALLWDMHVHAAKVVEFARGRSLEEYLRDDAFRLATERALEIVGEAASRVSAATRDAHPDIPWRSIIAQRNVLAHEYGGIDHRLMWQVVTVHVPELLATLAPRVPPTPPPSSRDRA